MAKTRSADRRRYWREVIERQQASGQSIVGFCAKEGLVPGVISCVEAAIAAARAWNRAEGGEAGPCSRADRR